MRKFCIFGFRQTAAAILIAGSAFGSIAADRAHRAPIDYPPFATVTAPKVLGKFNGVTIAGGFGSALAPDPRAPGYFYMLTDRGPNVDGTTSEKKVFPIPGFAPQIGRFKLEGDKLVLVKVIELKNAKGRKITGLPNTNSGGTGEIAVDLEGNPVGTDPDGLDSEGLVAMKDGSFWISDEYGPWLVHVNARGRTLERIGPFGGEKSLPRVLALRRPNRGMESLTITPDGRLLVGLMQNPVDNPDIGIRKTSRLNRLVTFDPRSGASRQYVYMMEAVSSVVSEIVAVTATSFIVSERDQLFAGDPAAPAKIKRIYKIDLAGASDVSDPKDHPSGLRVNGRTLEQMSDEELRAAGIVPVRKELVVDLLAMPGGYPHDKSEGLAIISDTMIAVANDDDFGIVPDGKGGIMPKRLPQEGDRVDENRIYFIRLDKPLK